MAVDKFGLIQGDALKKAPNELTRVAQKDPLVLNNQFYFVAEREAELILNDTLIDELLAHWKAALPVNILLISAINAI